MGLFQGRGISQLIILALALDACKSTESNSDSEVKIVGGTSTSEYPAVVAIYVEIMAREAKFMCTGALIAPDKVLTAAHCLEQPRLGFMHVFRVYSAADLREKSDRPRPATGRVAHFHPNFSFQNPKGGHDIGILTLAEPLNVQPIPIHRGPLSDSDVGRKVLVVGYGKSHGTLDYGEEVKRKAEVKLNAVTENKIEVGGFLRNVCRGDSGGPVLMTVGGVETIVGVNSYGDGSCRSSSVATRVDAYASSFIDPILRGEVRESPTQ